MINERLGILLDKYKLGLCNDEELQEINDLYEKIGLGQDFEFPERISLNTNIYVGERLRQLKKLLIVRGIRRRRIKSIRAYIIKVAATIILFIFGTFSYWYLKGRSINKKADMITIASDDVLPGHDGAILTLADGSIIPLDSVGQGVIASQGGLKVVNNQNGLSYQGIDSSALTAYNILETPRGRQYSVVLPDGSKVWLNAGSAIRYPTNFSGNARIVELRGEAYFEVVHNSEKPFSVKTSMQIIEDIGTHFNIQTYPDEGVTKTVLLDGSVKISNAHSTSNFECTLYKRGETAISDNINNDNIRKEKVQDADDVIAWKNGLFIFEDADIQSVMRTLSRWYDIDVEFSGKIPSDRFSGQVYRNMTLKHLLEGMDFSGINYEIKGRKIIISS